MSIYPKIVPVVQKDKIFKFRNNGFFLQFCYYLPLEKGMALQYEQS